jgi:hypothetical protein
MLELKIPRPKRLYRPLDALTELFGDLHDFSGNRGHLNIRFGNFEL